MVLSFDSGTTNTKAFLFDNDSTLLASASHPTKIFHRGAGIVEQDAENWWESVCKATEKLYLKHPWEKKDIESIGISSQGGTFVYLDEESRPISPAITWLDNRAASNAKDISSKKEEDFFYNKTGHYLRGWSPPAVHDLLKKKKPSLIKKFHRISFVADYLNYKLTDYFFIDPTSSQMSCLYNINKNKWDKDILEIVDIKEENLPSIINSDSQGGTTHKASSKLLNILEGTPVVAGGHDQYCASLGVGANKKGDSLLSCGTAWVLLITTDKLIYLPNKGWTPGRYTQKKHFGLMASIGNAGIILEWMRNNIKRDTSEPQIETGVLVEPNFSIGKGIIQNISLSTTGKEIYQVGMKSLVLKLKNRLDEVEESNPIKRLFMVGGATQEPFLPEMVEEITGKELILPQISEAAGKGAALLAINRK